MTGNANFTTPNPTAVVFDAALDAYSDKLDEIEQAEIDLAAMRSEKDALRSILQGHLTVRGSYVETTSGGDAAKILSAGFEIQSAGTPTTSLPQPINFRASIGDNAGEIDVACNAVKRAKSYVIEWREHIEGQAPGRGRRRKSLRAVPPR
jgi:hypothetical protein